MQALGRFRVLDFGTAWAAPMASQLLADMGAEVVKVESRVRLDGLRLGRPIVGDDVAGGDRGRWPELQPVFHGLNRNKLGITVNLKHADGVELIKRLAGQTDVVIHNYSPGVLERLGLDYDALRAVRPDIIVVGMPAAGETGPLSNVIAYAPIILALSGLMSMVGYEDGTLVGELQSAWSDAVAGLHAAMAAVSALRHRDATGQGQHVEVAQWEATTSWLGEAVMDWAMNARAQGTTGNVDPGMAPHNCYPCRGSEAKEGWVSIAVGSDEEWRRFCRAVESGGGRGRNRWTRDPRYADGFRRWRHRAELDDHIRRWTRRFEPMEVTKLLQRFGVAAMPVMTIEDQFLDPHFRQREVWPEVEHPMVGIEWLYGLAWRLHETPGSVRHHAPLLGEHNRQVLGELLGISESDLQRFERAEAVY